MLIFKKAILWSFLAILDALFGWSLITLIVNRSYGLAVIVFILMLFVNYALINPKHYPYRYMVPAVIMLFVLTVYPIYYTVEIALENYSTGFLWDRTAAMNIMLDQVVMKPNPEFFDYSVYTYYKDYKPTSDFVMLLKDSKGAFFIATKPEKAGKYDVSDFAKLDNGSVSVNGADYRLIRSIKDPTKIVAISVNGKVFNYFYSPSDSETLPNLRFFNMNYSSALSNTEFINPEVGTLFFTTTYGFNKIVSAQHKYILSTRQIEENGKLVEKSVLVDTITGETVREHDSAFWDVNPQTGKETQVIGYYRYVGFNNFMRLLTDKRVTGPFLSVFIWTFEWAALSVFFTFSVGLALAIVLNNKDMRFRFLYRTLLIIPWAVPMFISVIVWRTGFFNVSYGVINRIFLEQWFHLPPLNWLGDPMLAKITVLFVNTWLGFPYMMVIALGALQSIPGELYEAASIDGSSKWYSFRRITFPLLMTPLAPLLISSFAYNFNNFNVIYLLTQGNPPIPNAVTPAGATDILLSYTYKLAFGGNTGRDYSLAAAISILIFIIIASISAVNFRLSGSFEEVSR